jgi:hypothetical protein
VPEIALVPGLRDVGNGPSEQQQALRQDLLKNEKIQLWAFTGTEEECESNWREFLLKDAPEGSVILA